MDPANANYDIREHQHGLDFIERPNGQYCVIWSSSGEPLPPEQPGEWHHDVYFADVDPNDPPQNAATLGAAKLIGTSGEAQEPASAAISSSGNIMVTFEDAANTGGNVLAQNYGIFDSELNAVSEKAYPQTVFSGGHSGHVAAVGERFVVFWSEEWVDGGGVDDLGSGDDVYLSIYDSGGAPETNAEGLHVAVGDGTRDWWPIVAGSSTTAALVWQRFVPGEQYAELMLSLVDATTQSVVVAPVELTGAVEYYTYSVEYLPHIDRFLVLGSNYGGGGFGFLLDGQGHVVAENPNLPPIVRESQAIVRVEGTGQLVVQPTQPTGIMTLWVDDDEISLVGQQSAPIGDKPFGWGYTGTDGVWLDDSHVYVVTTSPLGLRMFTYEVEVVCN